MDYYHDLVTQKSWEELTNLSRFVSFVLIGGWAVYLYTKGLKSKDIDILVNFDALGVLKNQYAITRHERLKKYHAIRDVVDIDIYLPYYSRIGIPVEDLMGKTRLIEGFHVIDPNYLLALKLFALGQRGRTPKGRKDFLDILSLFTKARIDGRLVHTILDQYHLDHALTNLADFLSESHRVPELGMTNHDYAKLARTIREVLSM